MMEFSFDVLTFTISSIISILAILSSAWLIMHQIEKQAELTRENNNKNHQHELLVQLYEKQIQSVGICSTSLTEISTFCRSMSTNWAVYLYQRDASYVGQVDICMEFVEKHSTMSSNAADIIILIENYEIIEPRLILFKHAICSFLYDTRLLFSTLHRSYIMLTPVEENGSKSFRALNLDDEAERFLKFNGEYIERLERLGDILFDLRVELQNRSLSKVYDRKLDIRKPKDPDNMVLCLDPPFFDSCMDYYLNETPWGQYTKEVEHSTALKYTNNLKDTD